MQPEPIYDSSQTRSRVKSLRFSRHIREYFLFVVMLVGVTSLSSLLLLHRVHNQEDGEAVRRLNWAIDQLRQTWFQTAPEERDSLRLGNLAGEWGVGSLALAVRFDDNEGEGRWHFRSNVAAASEFGVWDSVTVALPQFAGSGLNGDGDYVRVVNRAEKWGDFAVVVHASTAAPQLGALQKLLRQEMWLRGFVLVAFGAFSILFFRLVLLPFRDMRKRAASLARSGALPDDLNGKIEDPEYVLATFDSMMQQLSEHAVMHKKRADRSERRVRDLERFNEFMLASMSTGVLIVGPDGLVMRLNRSAERILQLASDEVTGVPFDDAGFYPEMIAIIEEGLRDGYVYSRREVRIEQPRPDGPKYLGINTSRILNDRDQVIGLSVLLTDLTEIKRLYDDLAENQRLADLGEMAAGLAHQLRNSMAAIL